MRPPLLFLVALAAGPASASELLPGHVEVPGPLWERLQLAAPARIARAPGPFAATREVVLTERGDAVEIVARWTLDALEPGWFDGLLAGPGVRVTGIRWDDAPGAASSDARGTSIAGWVEGATRVELRGTLIADPRRGALQLQLGPATSGSARWVGDGLATFDAADAALADDGTTWTAAERVTLSVSPAPTPRRDAALIVASVGLGLTLDDTELRGRARLRWALRRGEAQRFEVDLHGIGDDLSVTGAGLRSAARVGDRLVVELQAPVRSAATVELSWTSPLPAGREASLAVPRLRPRGVFRTRTALSLSRDDAVEVVPDLRAWTPRPPSVLPGWARSLVDGAPSAAFTTPRDASGTLRLLRFEPVSGPAAVVDIADVVVATTQEGRALIRARYEVLNDRAAHLGVRLPPGGRLLSARLDGEPVRPVLDGDLVRVPLLRSVETLEGLISFPVELAVLVDAPDASWRPRERRSLQLPELDVQIAVHRTTVHLPPGWTAGKGEVPGSVGGFSRGEGISFGLGGAVKGAPEVVEQANALFGSAVDAWKDNDFEVAQGYLDQLGELGARNDNTVRLQSNLDALGLGGEDDDLDADGDAAGELDEEEPMVSPDALFSDAPPPPAAAPAPAANERLLRRIKDQAQARAEEDRRRYVEATRAAEEAERSGDYAKAEAELEKAVATGRKLGRLQQRESVDVKEQQKSLYRRSRAAKRKKKASKQSEVPARPSPTTGASSPKPADPLPLRAATRSVLVPVSGEAVLFQHLLIPAGVPVAVDVRARPNPRSPR